MGLDYTLSLRVKNQKDEVVREIELAYWRKCYGIRDCLHPLVGNLGRRADDIDYEAVCSTRHFGELVEALAKEMSDIESSLWTDSLWGGPLTQSITYNNMKVLSAMQYIFNVPFNFQREENFNMLIEDGSMILEDDMIERLATIDWETSKFEIVSYNSY